MEGQPASIVELPEFLDRLCKEDRQRWCAMYEVDVHTGGCDIPEEFVCKVQKWFSKASDENPALAAVQRVQKQRILSVFNKYSCDEVRFNSLRISRPLPGSNSSSAAAALSNVEELYASTAGKDKCDFCAWKDRTAADEWGRIFGKAGCVTASNVAKANMDHGVIILPVHHPLRALSVEVVTDVFETAQSWSINCVHNRTKAEKHPEDTLFNSVWYPQLLWNCGMGSGASQPHGHAQVILSCGRSAGRAEAARRSAKAYEVQTGRDFWDDLLWCHEKVGLSVGVPGKGSSQPDVHLVVHLTPIASHEILVFGRTLEAVGRGVHIVSQVLLNHFHARCFNIACALPPLTAQQHAEEIGERPAKQQKIKEAPWIVARILDSTDKPTARGSQFGATFATFELYGPAVDDLNPYETVQLLNDAVHGSAADN